jgi:hypothetical protein
MSNISEEIEYEIPYDKIMYFKGIIKNYKEIIDLIENINSHAVSPWEIWNSHDREYPYGEVKFLRKELLDKETDKFIKEKSIFLIDSLISSMIKSAEIYEKQYNIGKDNLKFLIKYLNKDVSKYGVNKYYENNFMGPHTDWNEVNSDLLFTIVIYLNDEYDDGELYFNNFELKIKPKAGSVVIFPSTLPYLHQSLKITKGRKMLITHHWKKIQPID